MKLRILSTARLSLPLASALAVLCSTSAVHAAALTWDAGNTANGTTIDPLSGNWNTTAGNIVWNNAGTNVIWDQTSTTDATNSAIFGGVDGTVDQYVVTLASQMATSSLTFNNSGYKLTGSTIYNTSGNLTVASGKTANIGSILAGVAGLTKLGSGSVTLNGSAANTFTGGLSVNLGTLALDFTNLATPTNLINATNALQINNGTLTITGKNVASATTAQTFASTSLGAGVNTVNIAKGALATSATLNLGALTVASGSSTIFSPTTAWTTTASTTERVFISAGGSVPTLPAGANTAFVNAGVFHRVAGGAAGSLRLAAVNSSGQLLLKSTATNVSTAMGIDPTNTYQYGASTSIALTGSSSIYGLLLNATSSSLTLSVANSGTLTLNSVIQIKTTESVNIAPGTGVSNVVIGAERNLVIAMDNTAGFGISAPIANNGSSGGVGGTASALTIVGTNPAGNPGTVTLSGANTYSGPTTITRGTLALSNVNALQNTSGLTLGGASAATLSTTTTGITLAAPITTANAGVTSTIAFGRATPDDGSLTLNGAIGGAGNVTFTTPNVSSGGNQQSINLGVAATYAGNTILNTGNTGNALSVRNTSGAANVLPTTTVLTFGTGAGSGTGRLTSFDLNGQNQTLAGLSNAGLVPVDRNQRVSSVAAATLTINNATDFTFGGSTLEIGGNATTTRAQITGAISLVKNGAGTFTLGGTLTNSASVGGNTYTGTTKILGGILVLGETTSIQSSAFDTTSIEGNVTNGLRSTVTTVTMGGLIGGNDFATRFTTTTGGYTGLTALTLNPGTGVTNNYSGDIGNGSGSMTLTKSGLGTQVFSGTSNSYTGITTINQGTLRISSINDFGAGNSSIGNAASGDIVIGSGNTGVLDYVGSGDSSNRTITVGSSTATNAGGAFILANGGAALTFTAATFNTAQAAATVARPLTLGGAGIGAIDGTIQDNNTAGGGKVDVTKQDAGTWTLSGANTYTGDTSITAGTLQAGAANVIPSGSGKGNVNLGGGASVAGTLDLNGFDLAINGLSGTTNTVLGTIVNNATGTNKTLTVGNGDATATFAGIIADNTSGTGTVALTKTGTGSQTLSGASTYTGETDVNAGTIVIGSTTALGSTAGGTVVASGAEVFMGTANLAVAENFNIHGNGVGGTAGAIHFGGGVSGMSISGAVTLAGVTTIKGDGGTGSTFTGGINNAGNALTFSLDGGATSTVSANPISGAGDLIKTSTGTLNLNVASTYTGVTTITAGKLLMGDAAGDTFATTAVTVASSATLGGSGTISGTLDVSGDLAPGATGVDIQTLAAGTTTWNGGSNLWQFDLSASAGSSDLLAITGDFNKGSAGAYKFDFMGSAPATWGNAYTLATWTNATTFDASDFTFQGLGGSVNGIDSYFTINGNSLIFTAVPEPSSALAGLLIAAGLLRRRRSA